MTAKCIQLSLLVLSPLPHSPFISVFTKYFKLVKWVHACITNKYFGKNLWLFYPSQCMGMNVPLICTELWDIVPFPLTLPLQKRKNPNFGKRVMRRRDFYREPMEQCVHSPGVVGSHCLLFQHTIEALPVGRLNGEQMDGQWRWCRQKVREPPASVSFKGLKVIVCIVIPLHCGVCNVCIHAMLAEELLAVVSREACTHAFIPPAPWSSNSMASMRGEQNTDSYVNEDYTEEWRDESLAAHPLTAIGGFSLSAVKYPTMAKFRQNFLYHPFQWFHNWAGKFTWR